MRVAIANDHRGVDAKTRTSALLEGLGYTVVDLGPNGPTSVDYPDYAIKVAEAVASGEVDRGILICATGHGMCIAANKVHGARAANCRDLVDAEMSRAHNDANIMCLSQDLVSDEMMERMVQTWIDTKFDGGRHARRLSKITQYEDEYKK